VRIHHWFGVRHAANSLGMIEANRNSPVRALGGSIIKSVHILEYGQIIGITPAGCSDRDAGQYNTGHSFAVYIDQQAEKSLGKKIPLIPIGVKKENNRFIIRIGESIYIPNGEFDRKQYALFLLEHIEKLAQ
jgi:hypothetical protein